LETAGNGDAILDSFKILQVANQVLGHLFEMKLRHATLQSEDSAVRFARNFAQLRVARGAHSTAGFPQSFRQFPLEDRRFI
jgi:hypothetical protein